MLQALVLGLVQGLTEFLPISSSAHLVLASYLLGWPDQGLSFDMAANTGSLLAVLVYFRRDLRRLAAASAGRLLRRPGTDDEAAGLAGLLLLATVPVALAGAVAQDLVAAHARRPLLIAAVSALFALLLAWADRRPERPRGGQAPGVKEALFIGVFQAFALIPGASRSGVTMTAGRALGMAREEAVRFSFLLAVPVGLLVAARNLLDLLLAGAPGGGAAVAIGFASAALSSFAAIHWLLGWVRRQSFALFVIYRLALSLAVAAAILL